MTGSGPVLLVGDVGGTNVRLALARGGRIAAESGRIWKRPGADFSSLEAAVAAFRQEVDAPIDGAAFGMAGPVRDGRIELLHRGWTVEADSLARALDVKRCLLVNDFVAMARSAPELGEGEVETITPGEAEHGGSIAVGGPGTGFGLGVLKRVSGGQGWLVVGGEGGHQAFGPQTEFEFCVSEILRSRLGYVSNEVVASGSGFKDTLAAVQEVLGAPVRELTPQEATEAAKAGDRVAVELARLRARTVMTSMGNLALLSDATGGVFLAGGVTQTLVPWLKERDALDRFYARGARTELMSRVPIRLITSQTAPLIGAAQLWLDEHRRGWL